MGNPEKKDLAARRSLAQRPAAVLFPGSSRLEAGVKPRRIVPNPVFQWYVNVKKKQNGTINKPGMLMVIHQKRGISMNGISSKPGISMVYTTRRPHAFMVGIVPNLHLSGL